MNNFNYKLYTGLVLLGNLLLLSTPAIADEKFWEDEIHGFFSIGMNFGSIESESGKTLETEFDQGLALSLGIQFTILGQTQLDLSLGGMYLSFEDKNTSDGTFDAYNIASNIYFASNPKHRFGLGVIYNFNPEFDYADSRGKETLDNSVSYAASYDAGTNKHRGMIRLVKGKFSSKVETYDEFRVEFSLKYFFK